ncbi:histidine kinase [Spirosoma sp. HMF4905]|uniref:histidine kinase n=2 Tax=Spirosoma arboris TaxID=2682092 RepID=A0A7K1S5E0_9BACT|nr:histidine kinase [Spirosoma arboris]
MKLTLLSVWLYLVVMPAFSQTVFRMDSLPSNGVVLDKNWKWHLGDNPNWANPTFDDSRWDTINPTQDIALVRQLPQQGIGWLHIHLHVAPRLRGQLVGIRLEQAGATEFFLNGKLLLRNGKISTHKDIQAGSIWSDHTSQTIQLEADSVQFIAIRYAFSRNKLPINRYHFAFFNLRLQPIEVGEKGELKQRVEIVIEAALFGVFLFLGLLQLLLYAVSTVQRTALFLGLFLVTQSIVHFMNLVRNGADSFFFTLVGITNVLAVFEAITIGFIVAITISTFYYLLGIYQYFGQPRKTTFWAIACITFTTIPGALFLNYPYNFLSQFIPGLLIPFVDILWIGILAIKRKHPGAKLFTLAHSLVLLIFISWTVSVFLPNVSPFLSENVLYLFSISFLALALTISLLLAQERAAINKLLRQQLLDLEVLSGKTIAQEQEKQQILSTQNERLEQQVEVRTAELNQSLTELKSTQTQLIQKEKLASLGELTAGIAHEIQNPLNFVNNFSEVSTELVSELQEEETKTDRDTELIQELLNDLSSNLQKINHHGGRASSIVKGMLEHSRTESGEKRPTDINALADEYLKIAYHGLKAKNKSFNCELVTDFDPTLGLVEVAPQEIGRVLLNLYNNAFYALSEKQKITPTNYQPTVSINTQRSESGIEIRVKDNGTGIPESVKAKIFQPFFTTKPTGEGTGLGLSLSYDIITKGHGGTLTVESQPGSGTEFIIHLPTKG